MILAAQLKRQILGDLEPGLVEALFVREDEPGHDKRLRARAAFDQAAVDEQLIEPDL
ncbi:MAG: hypothetical protein K0Q70_2922 [Rhodospirillales bacterium]|nr:hypothetical protein [Rhodospirillales bacterium]